MLDELEEPPHAEKDVVDLNQDAEMLGLVFEHFQCTGKIKALESVEKGMRALIIQRAELLGGGQSCRCGGVSISKVVRKGAIDYSKVPQLVGLDLSEFRKNNIESWRIS